MKDEMLKLKEMLDGVEYPLFRNNIFDAATRYAEENGIVIVSGGSDDLIEFYGAIVDEFGCYGGGDVWINREGVLHDPDCDCEYANSWYKDQKKHCAKITAIWNKDDIDWQYETDLPHITFDIKEDGNTYCRGILIDIDDIP